MNDRMKMGLENCETAHGHLARKRSCIFSLQTIGEKRLPPISIEQAGVRKMWRKQRNRLLGIGISQIQGGHEVAMP